MNGKGILHAKQNSMIMKEFATNYKIEISDDIVSNVYKMISNFKSNQNRKVESSFLDTVDDLERWCYENSNSESDSDLKVFNYEVTSEKIFIFISSNNLLRHAIDQQNFSQQF